MAGGRAAAQYVVPTDGNEEICGGCRKGGELLCCDACPAAFHALCTGYSACMRSSAACVMHTLNWLAAVCVLYLVNTLPASREGPMSTPRLPCSGCVEEVPDGEEWLCWACALSSGKPYLHSQTPVSRHCSRGGRRCDRPHPSTTTSRPYLGLHRGRLSASSNFKAHNLS